MKKWLVIVLGLLIAVLVSQTRKSSSEKGQSPEIATPAIENKNGVASTLPLQLPTLTRLAAPNAIDRLPEVEKTKAITASIEKIDQQIADAEIILNKVKYAKRLSSANTNEKMQEAILRQLELLTNLRLKKIEYTYRLAGEQWKKL